MKRTVKCWAVLRRGKVFTLNAGEWRHGDSMDSDDGWKRRVVTGVFTYDDAKRPPRRAGRK